MTGSEMICNNKKIDSNYHTSEIVDGHGSFCDEQRADEVDWTKIGTLTRSPKAEERFARGSRKRNGEGACDLAGTTR
jgi:hypothetical protein